jgi:hypothetical protein
VGNLSLGVTFHSLGIRACYDHNGHVLALSRAVEAHVAAERARVVEEERARLDAGTESETDGAVSERGGGGE